MIKEGCVLRWLLLWRQPLYWPMSHMRTILKYGIKHKLQKTLKFSLFQIVKWPLLPHCHISTIIADSETTQSVICDKKCGELGTQSDWFRSFADISWFWLQSLCNYGTECNIPLSDFSSHCRQFDTFLLNPSTGWFYPAPCKQTTHQIDNIWPGSNCFQMHWACHCFRRPTSSRWINWSSEILERSAWQCPKQLSATQGLPRVVSPERDLENKDKLQHLIIVNH